MKKSRRLFTPRLESLEERLVLDAANPGPWDTANAPRLDSTWLNGSWGQISAVDANHDGIPDNHTVVDVYNVSQLRNAIVNLQSNTTVLIHPGTYVIDNNAGALLNVNDSNVHIRGTGSLTAGKITPVAFYDSEVNAAAEIRKVEIVGTGMDTNWGNIFWVSGGAKYVVFSDLSIGECQDHPIQFQGESNVDNVQLHHLRLFNGGEMLIKGSGSYGVGTDNGVVEYCVFEWDKLDYVESYIQSLDVHGGWNWQVRYNLFRNCHAPEGSAWANNFNPALLFWNGSGNTTVEYNTFINNDRSVGFGLVDQGSLGYDHQGGVIANNFFFTETGFFAASQRPGADAPLIVWDSPGTQVYNNTIIVNGQYNNSIQTRFESSGIVISNNLADAGFRNRDNNATSPPSGSNNFWGATAGMFVNLNAGAGYTPNAYRPHDLHILDNAATRANVIDRGITLAGVPKDYDLQSRPQASAYDIGADELFAGVANQPPTVATPAAASPNPVSGATTSLSVLGADDAGEAGLTYTWAATAVPSGAAPTFSVNGTNGAKNATVTFNRAGSYTFQVTIRDVAGATVTSSVNVSVSQTVTTITVAPTPVSMAVNSSQQFTATARDQFGVALATQPAFAWSASGGTISATGLFTAGSTAGGPFTVTASSGGKSGSASVTLTAVNAPPTVATAASASPSPVTGASTSLSVLGADDGGAANLVYTWATTGTPPAAVTFSANGSNGASTTTATFTKAGTYSFQVTIRDAGGLTTTSNVSVTVNQALTSIAVTPGNASVQTGATQQYSAAAKDQFGAAMAATVTWTVSGGGSINASGLFTAGATAGGPFTVTASSGGKSGSANVTVTAVPPPPLPTGNGYQQDANGLVVMEAENFDANTARSGKSWVSYTATAGHSGASALTASPNTGVNNDTGYVTNSPRLDYQINFVKTGTHYVWIRGLGATGNDDSVHVGLDGAGVTSADRIQLTTGYGWTKNTMDGVVATINVTTAGVHTLNLWMREDGAVIDKVLLTTSSSYTPTGTGPAQSPRSGVGDGLAVTYFDNRDFTGASVSRIDPTINFNWGSGSPVASMGADTFSVRWTGKIKPRSTGTYTFYTTSDDGVRLWVNGQLIIDQWNDHAPTTHSGAIALNANQLYDIRVEYYENGGGAVMKLEWESASQVREVVPSSRLYSR